MHSNFYWEIFFSSVLFFDIFGVNIKKFFKSLQPTCKTLLKDRRRKLIKIEKNEKKSGKFNLKTNRFEKIDKNLIFYTEGGNSKAKVFFLFYFTFNNLAMYLLIVSWTPEYTKYSLYQVNILPVFCIQFKEKTMETEFTINMLLWISPLSFL